MDPGEGHTPGLHDCKLAKEKKFHMHWEFKQVFIPGKKKLQSIIWTLDIKQGCPFFGFRSFILNALGEWVGLRGE